MASLTSSSFLLWFQICSQLSTRLEKQQAAAKEELDIVRVSSDRVVKKGTFLQGILGFFRIVASFAGVTTGSRWPTQPLMWVWQQSCSDLDNHQEILLNNIKSLLKREADGLVTRYEIKEQEKFRGILKGNVSGAEWRLIVPPPLLRCRQQGGAAYFTMIKHTNCEISTCAMSAWQRSCPPQDTSQQRCCAALATC